MMEDKINSIINRLYNLTITDEIVWKTASIDKEYQSYKTLHTKSEDELTDFEVDIRYSFDTYASPPTYSWILNSHCSFWVRNKDLANGSMYISSTTYPILLSLRDLLKDKYCLDLIPSSRQIEDKLDDICKGISKSANREDKIGKILENEK